MKVVSVLGATDAVESFRLSAEVDATKEILLPLAATVCGALQNDLINLRKTHKLQRDMNLAISIDLFLGDPPYNIRSQQNLPNGEHDKYALVLVEEFCILCRIG